MGTTGREPDPMTLARVEEDRRREQMGMVPLERKMFDVATIPDADFEAGLKRITTRQLRMDRILDETLREGVHYGIPGGGRAFRKPMLYQAGAEELRNLFRLLPVKIGEAIVTETAEYVSVRVTMGVLDGAGRVLAPKPGVCTSKESRFKGKDGAWIYEDAREVLHVCATVAEKRALTLSTREACGATGFFAAEDDMDKLLKQVKQDTKDTATEKDGGWTMSLDQRTQVFDSAKAAGISSRTGLLMFVARTLGHDDGISNEEEWTKVIAAMKAQQEAHAAAATAGEPAAPAVSGEEETQPTEAPDAREVAKKELQEDLDLDRNLADQ